MVDSSLHWAALEKISSRPKDILSVSELNFLASTFMFNCQESHPSFKVALKTTQPIAYTRLICRKTRRNTRHFRITMSKFTKNRHQFRNLINKTNH